MLQNRIALYVLILVVEKEFRSFTQVKIQKYSITVNALQCINGQKYYQHNVLKKAPVTVMLSYIYYIIGLLMCECASSNLLLQLVDVELILTL